MSPNLFRINSKLVFDERREQISKLFLLIEGGSGKANSHQYPRSALPWAVHEGDQALWERASRQRGNRHGQHVHREDRSALSVPYQQNPGSRKPAAVVIRDREDFQQRVGTIWHPARVFPGLLAQERTPITVDTCWASCSRTVCPSRTWE